MEIITCEQGTEEWFAARRGIPTASEFNTVMAKGKGNSPSKTRQTYLLKLVGERLTGESQDGFSNKHTERGHLLEPEAADLYSFMTGNECELVGFIKSGEKGCSPDRLIGDDGLLEIKTKLPHLQLSVLESGVVPSEHIKQIQGQIWIAEREWCDFISYWPKLPPFIKRVYRDDKLIKELDDAVNKFIEEMLSLEAKYSYKGE